MHYKEYVPGYGAFLPGPSLGTLVVEVLGILHHFQARGTAACACASYSRLDVFVTCTLDATGHCFFELVRLRLLYSMAMPDWQVYIIPYVPSHV